MKIRPVFQWMIGIVLAAAGMWIFFRSVDVHNLSDQLIHSNPLALVCSGALAIASIWLRAVRSSLLLPSCTAVQKKNLFPILMIAFMVNNILPARAGEAARAMLLWKRNKYSGAISVGSIILERILDTLVFLSCFFLPVFIVPGLAGHNIPGAHARELTLQSIALAFAAVFVFFSALLIVYSRFPQAVRRAGSGMAASSLVPLRFRKAVNRVGRELISNLDWTFSFRRATGTIILSYAIVSCYAASTVILIHDKMFGFLRGLFSQAFAACGAAIPLSPGYVGTLHAVFFQGLVLCGISRDKAGAITILFHAVPYLFVTALGLYYYFRFEVKFKDISNAKNDIVKNDEMN